jgi:hypothetical protein
VFFTESIVYESGEDAEMFEAMLGKELSTLGIRDNIPVRVEDFAVEDFELEISIVHAPQHSFPNPESKPYEISGSVDRNHAPKPSSEAKVPEAQPASAPLSSVQVIEDDDIAIVDTIATGSNDQLETERVKRKRDDADQVASTESKKSKASPDAMEIVD